MAKSDVEKLKKQAVEAVTEMFGIRGVDLAEVIEALGEVIVEAEYSIAALKDKPEPVRKSRVRAKGNEEPAGEQESPKARRGVRRTVRRKT